MIKIQWTGDVCQLLAELSKINEEFTFQVKSKRVMISFGDFYTCALIGDVIEIPEELILIPEEVEIIEKQIEIKEQPSREVLVQMYKEWGYEYTG
jgi:hypothetical protein